MAKKLSMSKVKSESQKYNESTTISFDDDIEVKFFPYFSNERINKILTNLRDDLLGFESVGIKLDDDLFIPFTIFHTILGATDISSPIKSKYKKEEDYFKTKAQFFREFINTHYFNEITEYFIDAELNKIWDKLVDIQVANEKLEREMSKLQQQIQNLDLQSPELKNRLKPKQIPEV